MAHGRLRVVQSTAAPPPRPGRRDAGLRIQPCLGPQPQQPEGRGALHVSPAALHPRAAPRLCLLKRGRKRIALAIFTQFNPDHAYGKQTLRGVASRLLAGLN